MSNEVEIEVDEGDPAFYKMIADGAHVNLIATLKGWDAQVLTPGLTWSITYKNANTLQVKRREELGEVYCTVSHPSRRKVLRMARKKLKEVRAYCMRKASEGEVSDS